MEAENITKAATFNSFLQFCYKSTQTPVLESLFNPLISGVHRKVIRT